MLHLWARKFKGIIGSEEGWLSASSISWQPVDLALHSAEPRFELLSKLEGSRVFVGKGFVNSNRPLSDVNKGLVNVLLIEEPWKADHALLIASIFEYMTIETHLPEFEEKLQRLCLNLGLWCLDLQRSWCVQNWYNSPFPHFQLILCRLELV